MNNEEAFLVWAPPSNVWSDWAKPVAFAQASAAWSPPPAEPPGPAGTAGVPAAAPESPASTAPVLAGWQSLPIDWLPPAGDTALVLDLPGTIAVAYGLAVAARGYRPVPLHNACMGPSEIVNMQQISRALLAGAEELQTMTIPEFAPPAFVLDAERLQGEGLLKPGRFDNRWMVFPQDFPSGNKLLSQRVRRILVVFNGPVAVPDDLAHVLLRWKDAGLELLSQSAQQPGPPQPLQVVRPKLFKSIWHRLLAAVKLRRNSAGGFGSIIPQPSSGVG